MSNKELNSVPRDELLQTARDAGLEVEEQSAYYRCSFPGSPARIYVAKTQKVSRVDLAEFCTEHAAVKEVSVEEAKALRLGKIRGQLDFTQSPETVLSAMKDACEALKEIKAPERKKPAPKKAKAPKNDETEQAEAEVTAAMLAAQQLEETEEETSLED
jgi:hypothetical protein